MGKTTTYRMTHNHTHPETLASGADLAPGESISLTKEEAELPANKRLIDEGIVLVSESAPAAPVTRTGEGSNS